MQIVITPDPSMWPALQKRSEHNANSLMGYVEPILADIKDRGDAALREYTMRFDGYVVIAIADLSQIEEDPSREFVEKALALRDEPLLIPKDFPLDDWAAIADAAMRIAPLLSVNVVEDADGEVSYIGQLAGIESDALLLREVDPNARWHSDAGDYGFDEIASIGFGTGYLDALWQVACSPSNPMSPRVPRSDSLH